MVILFKLQREKGISTSTPFVYGRFEERCVLPVLPCCELERVLVWIVTYNNSFQLTSPLQQWSSRGSYCVSAAGREMAPHGGGGTFV